MSHSVAGSIMKYQTRAVNIAEAFIHIRPANEIIRNSHSINWLIHIITCYEKYNEYSDPLAAHPADK